MKLEVNVYCTHTEPDLQKNVKCEPIEKVEIGSGAVFRCPQCKREIVVDLKILEEEQGE